MPVTVEGEAEAAGDDGGAQVSKQGTMTKCSRVHFLVYRVEEGGSFD